MRVPVFRLPIPALASLLLLLFGCAASAPVVAATPDADLPSSSLSEREFIGDLPVVLSVSRLAQHPRDTPASVTVIDREMIRASGARELADLFRFVPGFTVGRPPSAGTVVTYHGLTETFPRRVQVLLDGRSLYSPFYFGGIEWNVIPVALDDIERIEIVRGSNSAAFGANAFLGVANIVTRSGQATPMVTAELRSGQGHYRESLARVAGSTDAASWRVSAHESRDDGVDNVRDDRRRRVLDARLDARPTPVDQFTLRVSQAESFLQVGNGGSGNPFRSDAKVQQAIQLNWQRALADNSDVTVRYFRTIERGTDGFTVVSGPLVVPVRFDARAIRDDLEVQHTLVPNDTARLVWGGGWRHDSVRSPAFFHGRPEVENRLLRLFGNLEWRPLPAATLNLGATYEHDRLAGGNTAPRLATNFHLPDRAGTLRLGIARSYRTPSLVEAEANQAFVSTDGVVRQHGLIGTAGLRPESLLSREVGYLFERPEWGLSADFRGFNERITDRIDTLLSVFGAPYCATPPRAGPLPYCETGNKIVNFADGEIRGLEHRIDWRPRAATRLTVTQSFVRITATPRVAPESYPGLVAPATITPTQQTQIDSALAHQRESAPTHAAMLTWIERLPGSLELSATHWWQGAMKWTGNTRAPAYRRLDWRLALPFRDGPARGELAFTVIGDGAQRIEHSSNGPIGKRGFVALRLEY